jgi:hypothetical protein
MKRVALFLLMAKEQRKVSQTALDGLISDFTELLQQSVDHLMTKISVCLQRRGLNISSFEGLQEAFGDPCIVQPFKHLHSKHLQESFYREHLDLLVCSYLIGEGTCMEYMVFVAMLILIHLQGNIFSPMARKKVIQHHNHAASLLQSLCLPSLWSMYVNVIASHGQ